MLALRLPLRLAARATPSHARIATPIVASSLSATISYRSKSDATNKSVKKPTKKPTKKPVLSKKAQKEAAAKAAYKLLSPEEKAEISANANQAKKKEELKLLKAQALSPPTYRPVNIWSIYVKENSKAKAQGRRVSEAMKSLGEDFKSISSSEKEHYNRLIDEHNAKSLREFQEWLNGHTPAQIHHANLARSRLRKLDADHRRKYMPIKDDRLVRRPSSVFFHYYKKRKDSGDYRDISVSAAVRNAAKEFRALSASEKKKYQDMTTKDIERYNKEHLEVYGFEKPEGRKAVKGTVADVEAEAAGLSV